MIIGHELLHRFSRTIVLPKLKTALYVFVSSLPVTLNVGFECLSEYRVELLNVSLEAHNIAIESEHVVNAFVFEALNVD